MAVSFPQDDEHAAFSSVFPVGGIHSQGILLVLHLELQEKSINHFYDTAKENSPSAAFD